MPRFPVPGLDASRVLVYGVTGSGKSTLARRLSAVTGLPYHEIDALTWGPSWTPEPREVQRSRVAAVLAQDAWVVDHCYGWMVPSILARADLVVGLDLPYATSYARLLRRTLVNAATGRPTFHGNVETWRTAFDRDSMLWWHPRSAPKKRARMRAWAAGTGTDGATPPPTLLLTSPAQVHRWVAHVEQAQRA